MLLKQAATRSLKYCMTSSENEIVKTQPREGAGVCFWILGALLVFYVALCTSQRDNMIEADAWEHHRALKALTRDLWHPGNPTFATDDPSIRYSPYMVTLAVLCRSTGLDPYDALSGAAVLNTILLVLGVRAFLGALGHARAGTSALIIMVSLFGGAPGYANSYALSDLPWHQVNPSALSFALALFMWSLLLHMIQGGSKTLCCAVLSVLLSVAVLDHGMTGVFGAIGLVFFAATAEPSRRLAAIAVVFTAGIVALMLCLAWPWYSFGYAIRTSPDNDYWFNPVINRLMLTQWCAPAIVLSLFALTSEDRRTVRRLLAAGGFCLGLALLAIAVRSPSLARLPLPALVFAHLSLAIFADESALFRLSSWPRRLRTMVFGTQAEASRPVMEVVLAVMVVGLLVPQVLAVIREPHLARAVIAPLMGREDKQVRIRAELERLMTPVDDESVVLSDPDTAWIVPSVHGRIVSALHYEFFSPDQSQRDQDVLQFFGYATETERREILDRYHVSWILVDTSRPLVIPFSDLIREEAIVRREGKFVLMDANKWRLGPK